MNPGTISPALFETARNILSAVPACHDWDHTVRVLNNARHLAEVEGADLALVECAALLHHIGRPQALAGAGQTAGIVHAVVRY